jgi:hypothetical protein
MVFGRTLPAWLSRRPAGSELSRLPAGSGLSRLPAGSELSRPSAQSELSRLPGRNAVRRWLPRIVVAAVVGVLGVELAVGWPSLSAALAQLRAPEPGWLAAGLVVEIASMTAYARMQRHLMRSAGVRAPLRRHVTLAFAAHSLSVSLPGGTAFSTRFNYQQMRRLGAGPAVASWAIAFSGILSGAALAVVSAASAIAANGTPQWRTLLALTVVGLALLLGIRWVTAHPDRLEPAARTAMSRVNRALNRPPAQGVDQVHAFVEQLRAARLTPAHGTAAGAHAVLNWLFDAAALWMCLSAVTDTAPAVTQVLLAFCAGMAAGTITVVPAGLGILDNALIVALVATGVPAATAIAAVVLYRILTLGLFIGAGWIAWLTFRGRAAMLP